jgi:hypothetical protein
VLPILSGGADETTTRMFAVREAYRL